MGFRYEDFKWLCISACAVIAMVDVVTLLPKRQSEHCAEVLTVGSHSRNLMIHVGEYEHQALGKLPDDRLVRLCQG